MTTWRLAHLYNSTITLLFPSRVALFLRSTGYIFQHTLGVIMKCFNTPRVSSTDDYIFQSTLDVIIKSYISVHLKGHQIVFLGCHVSPHFKNYQQIITHFSMLWIKISEHHTKWTSKKLFSIMSLSRWAYLYVKYDKYVQK